MFDEFQKEQNELLENLVFNGIYPKLTKQDRHAIIDGINDLTFMLEIYLTSACNKHCEYCYLQQHKTEIYPPEFDKPELVKKNLRILFNSFIERGYKHLNRVDIFSGEIWDIDYGYDILDIVLTYIKAGFKIDNFVIPTNGSFLYNDKYYNQMKDYIEAFSHYDCNFVLSFSYDGYYLEKENRPFYNEKKNQLSQDLLIERLKEFHELYSYGFHPMVYAENINKQIENFDWWTQFLDDEDIFENVMFLEVRNNNWTDEFIIGYLKWLKHIMEYHYKYLKSHESDFTLINFIEMCLGRGELSTIKSYNYLPQRLTPNRTASCGLTQGFCVRLGDLAICPCHRTAYDKLLLGKFIVQDNKIIGIEANNPSMAINIWMNGDNSWLKCDACSLRKFCIKGCRGSQFETHREPMYPADTACECSYAKELFLIVSVLNLINDSHSTIFNEQKHDLLTILKNTELQDSGRYNKWITIIQTLPLSL